MTPEPPLQPRAISQQEMQDIFARLVAGWANHLSPSGARMYGDGYHNFDDTHTPYQGVTRMLPALSAWLSQPNRPTVLTWQGQNYNIAELLSRSILNGCDLTVYDNWVQHPAGINQHTVEAWSLSFALWQARQHTWDTYTPQQQSNIVHYLSMHSEEISPYGNNWVLFAAINHMVRKQLGQPYNPDFFPEIERQLDGMYLGAGWFDETDDYNWWGFVKMLTAWKMLGDDTYPSERFMDAVREGMRDYPYQFTGDGDYARWGRSLTYKFCRLVAPVWAYHLGLWEHSTGMLRRLVSAHLRWYLDRGAIRPDGLLHKMVTPTGSPYILERYTGANSHYWAMMAFSAIWTLADDDPFWTADEEKLPLETSDYTRIIPSAGQILVGTKENQTVRRYIGFIREDSGRNYAQKYGKYVYESRLGFAAGDIGNNALPDNMLSLHDGRDYGHRHTNIISTTHPDGWLRMRYHEVVNNKQHTIDTAIIPHDNLHLRVHHITLAEDVESLQAIEGAGAIGYEKMVITPPYIIRDDENMTALANYHYYQTMQTVSAIRAIQGYDSADVLNNWFGQVDLHVLGARFLLPVLKAQTVRTGDILISLVYSGTNQAQATQQLQSALKNVTVAPEGTITVQWAGRKGITIPTIYPSTM